MFRHMEYVYTVYQTRSFSKAAEKLFIAQPSLSATIKKVEKKVGSPLFDRSTNPIRLTQCGEEYIKCVEKIMDVQNGFSNYLSDSKELTTGTITIGACNFFASYILPPIIAGFKATYPHVTINLVEAESARAMKLLFDGELDMIVDNYSVSEMIYKKYLFSSEVLILAVPKTLMKEKHKKYALSAKDIRAKKHLENTTKSITLNIFDGIPFIALRHGNDTRERMERMRQAQRFSPNIVLELDQLATAYHVACHGLGITLTSDTLVMETPIDERLVYFRLDNEEIYRNNYFYYKQGKYLSRSMKKFISYSTSITLE